MKQKPTQIILEIDGREYTHTMGMVHNIQYARNFCRETYTAAKTIIKSILNVIPVNKYGEQIEGAIIDCEF